MTVWSFGAASLATAVAVLVVILLIRRRAFATSAETARPAAASKPPRTGGVGIAHLDPEGRWLRVNDRSCEIAGHQCADLMREPLQNITHPDDIPLDVALSEALLSGRMNHASIEKRYISKEGRIVWINETRSLVRDPECHRTFFISIVGISETHTDRSAGRDRRSAIQGHIPQRGRSDGRDRRPRTIQSLNPASRAVLYRPRNSLAEYEEADARNHRIPPQFLSGLSGSWAALDHRHRREVVGRRRRQRFPLDLSVNEWMRGSDTFFTA